MNARRLRLLALIAALAAIGVGYGYVVNRVTDYDAQGHALYKAGRYVDAAEAYGRALDFTYFCSNDEIADLYCDRGDAHDLAGQVDLALADYGEAIRRAPSVSRYWFERGIAYQRAKRYPDALSDMNRALSLHSGRSQYNLERGAVLLEMGEYRKAIGDFDEYLSRPAVPAPSPATATRRQYRCYDLRGWAHYQMGEYGPALADIDRALAIQPDYAQAWEDRARVLDRMGQPEKAREAREKALRFKK